MGMFSLRVRLKVYLALISIDVCIGSIQFCPNVVKYQNNRVGQLSVIRFHSYNLLVKRLNYQFNLQPECIMLLILTHVSSDCLDVQRRGRAGWIPRTPRDLLM